MQPIIVEILYNPYQGLKRISALQVIDVVKEQVEILYNPYQGLKRLICAPGGDKCRVEILYNPYQGLKHQAGPG
ncbi:hypothetical protein MC7420_764 [Coleofasciculus chthonoplastes PCC 7420]|uniref:Uncharacterized protein n=1 Tax=Coleofasciculus chthonoplastes PCC 7420 TaxID=118168 RepID=B4VST1_9CYAN|nr:hypothetical protein MC7420_764 [Coleofasciculus chthonoplastes PCC 7420]